MSLAGDFSPAASTDQQPCTGLEPLLDSKLRCAPTTNSPALDSNLSRTPNELKSGALHPELELELELELALSTPTPNELISRRLSPAFYWVRGWRLVFYLRPFTPRWLRTFCFGSI